MVIDEDKCDGCGLCIIGCAEGAIKIIDKKARLVAENRCDGMGDCIGSCPKDAISIEVRPVADFDGSTKKKLLPCGCPGTMERKITTKPKPPRRKQSEIGCNSSRPSYLSYWPVQLTLLSADSETWKDADVVIAADCVGFAMPDFHEWFLSGENKALAIACPKLDNVEPYIEKLASIFAGNTIRSITVAHMEVPCCSELLAIVKEAMKKSGRTGIRFRDVTVSVDGSITNEG